jgi:archaellum component FlaC
MDKYKNLKNIGDSCKKVSEALNELGSSFKQVTFVFSKINKDLKPVKQIEKKHFK